MKLKEFINAKVGTKIYRVSDGSIKSWFTLSNPTGTHLGSYFYLVNGGKVLDAEGFYLPNHDNDFWTDSYDDAKEEMWKQEIERLKSKNRIFFNNSKNLIEDVLPKYDPHFGDDKKCKCGHSYHRHFDTYEDMDPVGCKYCGCQEFKQVK